ncbi:MAG: flagellar biosynthesis anti-sigma factor FlgM [Bryobacteraceae bacterium]
MRVDEHTLTDQVSSTAGRAAESQRIQIDTATTSGAGSAAAGDRVDLSGLAGRITQAMQSLSSQSAQRVGQLQKQVRAGAYQPDAGQIAGAMVQA